MATWILGICLVTMTMSTIKAQMMSLEGCDGMTKGCFQEPDGCSPDSCDFFLSWVLNDDGNIVFDMTGDAISFVALGFSKSGLMANSDVYACTGNNEVVRSRNTVGNINDPSQQLKGVTEIATSADSGRLKCRFTRETSLNDGDSTFYDLSGNNEYQLIMSKSSSPLAADGNIVYHSGGKVIGPKRRFTQFGRPNTPPTSQDGCSTTMGCFEFPSGCPGPDSCEFYLTWTLEASGNNVFDMTGTATKFVAVGFSKSGRMANSDVFACTSNNEVVRSRNTVGNTNEQNQKQIGISQTSFSVTNGRMRCQFERAASLQDDDGGTYYDLSSGSYTIIMSKSNDALTADGNIVYHSGGRTQAGSPTDFTALTSATGAKDNTRQLQKSHGSLMIIAWMGFASIALTIARYFRPIFPGKKVFGTAIWFQVHRASMIAAFLLTIAAFVIIFVSAGAFVELGTDAFSRTRFSHAVLGTVVTFLAIVNPIMAIFRPHPGEPNRPYFNYAHRSVGLSAHIIGLVTILLALGPYPSRPFINGINGYTLWIMVVFLAFHVVFWIGLEIRKCTKTEPTKKVEIPMTDNADRKASTDQIAADTGPSENDSLVMNMLFFTYTIVALILMLVLLISVIAA